MRWITMAALLALAGCGGGAAPGRGGLTTPPGDGGATTATAPGGAAPGGTPRGDRRAATATAGGTATPSGPPSAGTPAADPTRRSAGPGGAAATATATATPAHVTAVPNRRWTLRAGRRSALRCPASSSRAGWPSRVLALGGGEYVKLWGRRPRLASVDAGGHLLSQRELGARRTADERTLACGRGGRTAAAWTEYRGRSTWSVRVDGRTIETIHGLLEPPSLAVAFAPDGRIFVAYSVTGAVRGVFLPGDTPFTLGPASEAASVAAEITRSGRAIVAWTTIDAGEERNERRRVYAVAGRDGRFERARLVDRAKHLNISEDSTSPIRLAVAPNGRALLMWATATTADVDDRRTVRIAEAGRDGRFRRPRQLSKDGHVGDVAIRGDGRTLAVWTTYDALYANRELVVEGTIGDPRASFAGGRPRIEWRDGAATRR